ncbi:MAG: flagellar basal body rod protein FlgC [Deltaproteobacteria bacterium]|nr:MAG: flagellar basal body rod protein FlgC [Deltaproteobacteria bacterium]
MDLFKAMEISATGMNTQRVVMGVISTNIANAQTTRTEAGGPYRRQLAILSPTSPPSPFFDLLSSRIGRGPSGQESLGVKAKVVEDPGLFRIVYDPSHPDADETGYVALPNVNVMEEMVYLLGAVRSYEANVTTFNAAKGMILKSLEIGR